MMVYNPLRDWDHENRHGNKVFVNLALGDLDVGDKGVELVDAVLVLVPEPGEADPHPEGDAPHALGPDGLVQPCVDPHVLGSHLLLCKLLDLLDSSGSPVLEADAVEPLVEVDSVFAGHHLAHCAGLLSAGHLSETYFSLVEVNQAIL